MTPEKCVFDLTVGIDGVPPRRPGIDDVGGGQKQDEAGFEPNSVTDPTAKDFNQWSNLAVRYGALLPVAILSVHFASGTPSIFKVTTVIDAVQQNPNAFFTVTDNGTSDTTVSWPANTFPAATVDHDAKLTANAAGQIACQTLTHSARVRTSGTDLSFNLYIYGD